MVIRRVVKNLFAKKHRRKENLQFFKIGDHVVYHIIAPDTIGNDINKIKFFFVDENGQLISRTNIASLLSYEYIVKRQDCYLFALVVSPNPYSISITVNGIPYQAQTFSEEILSIQI